MTIELADIPLKRMEQAYLEFRRACADLVYQGALERGLLEALAYPRSAAEFSAKTRIPVTEKRKAELFLETMVRHGAVYRIDGEPARYMRSPSGPPRREFDEELILLATGKRRVEELKDSTNYARIASALTVIDSADNLVAATFDGNHLPLWEEALRTPYYRYLRVRAARETASAGRRLLDLGCGLGYGLQELAEVVPDCPDTVLVGVDADTDLARMAIAVTADNPRIWVTRGDIQQPLEFLAPGYFDGAMVVGTYHFLSAPDGLWDNLARLLRPNGVCCISYVRSRVGSEDQELMDLRYALRGVTSVALTRDDVMRLAAAKGFVLMAEYTMGCWRAYTFVLRTGEGGHHVHRIRNTRRSTRRA